jgi:undecaprenyl-diphosphatase
MRPRDAIEATGTLGIGLVVATACGVLFAVLAHAVARGAFDHLDESVLRWVSAHRTSGWTHFFSGITDLGSGYVLVPLTVGAAIALWLGGRPGMGVALGIGMIGAGVLDTVLKWIVARPRPDEALRIQNVHGYAFPSGHTAASFVFFLTVALLVAGHAKRRKLRDFLVAYALFLGGLVGASRIYLGVHYPSDVLGGFLVALAWSIAVTAAEHLWRHHGQRFIPSEA